MGKSEDDYCCVECGKKTPDIDLDGLSIAAVMELCRTNKCRACRQYDDEGGS